MNRSIIAACAVLLLSNTTIARAQDPAPACTEWHACRDLAEQARTAGEYETFHDLAWRAIQTRGQRDPDLLLLLARAQSLSGRPHDALVTLRRLAQEFHVATDVTNDEDFRRVRALAGWPDVQTIIAAVNAPPPEQPVRTARQNQPPEPPVSTARQNQPPEPPVSTARENRPAEPRVSAPQPEEVARFSAPSFTAGGLAYDAVSRRFVIGNLPTRKLAIVEEGTNRSATLSGDAAQLLDVRALEIDRKQGDLWVVSEGSRDHGDDDVSELHKLQLVSGRVLTVYAPHEESDGPSRFVDVAIGPVTGVLVLDARRPRLVRPSRDGKTLTPVIDLPAGDVTSLAPDDNRVVYVAYDDRLERVDLSGLRVERVVGEASALSGFERLRWHKGSLVGVQKSGGHRRVVQLRLSRGGTAVKSARVLDEAESTTDVSAAVDLLEDEFYYLVAAGRDAAIRRIRLK